MGCYFFSSQCDDSDLFVCRTVVVDRPIVAKGNIKSGQILYPIGIAATNHIRRNIVASLSHTGRDAFDSLFGGRQPKIEQRHKIAFRLRPLHEFHKGTGRQRRFKRKILAFGQKIVHSLQHQPSCLDRHAFGIERRQPFCIFIGIDELFATNTV